MPIRGSQSPPSHLPTCNSPPTQSRWLPRPARNTKKRFMSVLSAARIYTPAYMHAGTEHAIFRQSINLSIPRAIRSPLACNFHHTRCGKIATHLLDRLGIPTSSGASCGLLYPTSNIRKAETPSLAPVSFGEVGVIRYLLPPLLLTGIFRRDGWSRYCLCVSAACIRSR